MDNITNLAEIRSGFYHYIHCNLALDIDWHYYFKFIYCYKKPIN